MLLKSALLNIIFVTYAAAQSFPLGPFPPNGNRPSINSEKAAENGYEIERHTTRCDRRSDSDSGTESDRDGRDGRDRHRHHHSSHCSSSRHSSSHCRTSTSHCRTSTSHCHSTTSCHSTTHCKPTRSECCSTKTVTTTIDNKCCYLLIHPCPTNSAVTVTSTVSVLPTQASVLPTQAVLAPVCTPCTDYVTTTTMPNLACTTMIFCDVAGQSENCIAKNEQDIEAIVSRAARDGSQVFVNGQLVVFRSGSSSASVSASSGSTVLTVTGQQANDASAAVVGSGLVGLFGAIAGFLLFGI